VFGNVVTFQSYFYLEIHQIIFFILKKLFLTLEHQNNLKNIKKILI